MIIYISSIIFGWADSLMPGLWGSAAAGAFGRGAERAAVSQCIEGKGGGGLTGTGPMSEGMRCVMAEGEEGANVGVRE